MGWFFFSWVAFCFLVDLRFAWTNSSIFRLMSAKVFFRLDRLFSTFNPTEVLFVSFHSGGFTTTVSVIHRTENWQIAALCIIVITYNMCMLYSLYWYWAHHCEKKSPSKIDEWEPTQKIDIKGIEIVTR